MTAEDNNTEDTISWPRMISFSDAIFAFAITLLVLKIELPALPGGTTHQQLVEALRALWPQYLANIISFLVIGNYWIMHHRIFNSIKRHDMIITWMNMFLLLLITFIPFPTDLLGNYPSLQISTILYSGTLALVGIMQLAIWVYASDNHRLIDKSMSNGYIRFRTIRGTIAPTVFIISMWVSFYNITIANFCWLAIFLIVPFIRYKGKITSE